MPKPSTRRDEILAIYDKYGGMLSLRRLTQYCWEEGVWNAEDQRHMAFAAAKRECHAALQTKNSLGLPVAGQSPRKDGTARIWVQLQLWDEDTARFNLAMRLRQVEKDYDTIEAIWRYYEQRWGNAPPIPRWEYPEEAPMWWYDEPSSGEPEPLDEDEDD
jgi:hypothetical protein